MTPETTEELEAQIERLVRDHLTKQHLAAKAAVERAFAAVVPAELAAVRRRGFHRRAPTEVAELAERLWGAVSACPGETMSVIAARVGEKPQALSRPMVHLKRTGRVRSAGERNSTRYFPMSAGKPA